MPAINVLSMDPSFDGHSSHNNHLKGSLLPFLDDTLRWLMGTATTKDVNGIKNRVNQLIEAQSTQQETLVHIITILNIIQIAAQVNRHSINVIMDKVDETVHDVNNLYSLTTSIATSLSYHQLILHIRPVLENLWDSLSYIRTVSMHTMDYVDAATTGQCCNILTPFQPFANPPSCATALYTKNTPSIAARCSLQVWKTPNVSIPSQIAPNVWILTTAHSAVTTAITPICPGETTKFITIRKPIHIL